MSRFALDASVMIAAVCAWHESHGAALADLNRRLDAGASLVVPAHAVLEAYAVLTRLPAPHRLAPADAWALIDANFIRRSRLTALGSAAYARLIRRLAAEGVGGGRSYDALIGECARRARPAELVTLNPRHFDPPPRGITVVTPAR